MIRERELAELDAMLDATLQALLRRANAADNGDGMVAFDVGEADVEELWWMIEQARDPAGLARDDEAPISFEVGDADETHEGRIARLYRESAEKLDGLLSSLATPHVIETGEGPAYIRTRMGWLGDTRTETAPGVPASLLAAHVATTEASLTQSAHRMYVLAKIVSAAATIASAIAAPSGALMALPIAFKCVRDVHRRWSTSGADSIG
ncbi:hypothetical protein [Paraliomyxa miuraensis]|uniref:hypothetical protein n=1 Tax=Paraliomyxa miuraensis TaxID=376150 RepID=UPI00224DACFC|nr:hypothetical protein [Paraliomyxa miuraensis]MCX4245233.1 hypothetical protein [Paraliomyxa miuraensis]